MNGRLEAKLGMIMAVQNYWLDSPNKTAADTAAPVIVSLMGDLETNVDSINSKIVLVTPSTHPVTANKAAARDAMVSAAVGLAGMCYAFAVKNNFIEDQAQFLPWIKKSAFATLKDNIVNSICQNIHDWAEALTTISPTPVYTLVSFGVVDTIPADPPDPEIPGTIDTLDNLIQAYNSTIALPEAAIEDRKANNVVIVDLFSTADQTLKNLDSIIYQWQFLEVGGNLRTFYEGWVAARTIFDNLNTHTGIRGTVTAAATGLPVQGVKITAYPNSDLVPGAQPIIVYTDMDGKYLALTPKFKAIPYIVKAQKTGYSDEEVENIFVARGKKTTQDFALLLPQP